MTDYASMTARELRKIAPEHGVTGASRMSKEQIVEALTRRAARSTLKRQIDRAMVPRISFDRATRDALKPQPVVLHDPAAGVDSRGRFGRAHLSRAERRHVRTQRRGLDGVIAVVTRQVPRKYRDRGLQVPYVKAAA